jgi:hypothetical protein
VEPWFGAERTLITAVAGLFRRQQSLKGADIGIGHVAVGCQFLFGRSAKGCYE